MEINAGSSTLPRIQPLTIKVYARHSSRCSKRGKTRKERSVAKFERHCSCPKWIYVNVGGKDTRFSAKTRSWAEAEKIRQATEDSIDPLKAELHRLKQKEIQKSVPLADAIEAFFADHKAQGVGESVTRNDSQLFRRFFLPWAEKTGLQSPADVATHHLTSWRSTWVAAPSTKKLWQTRFSVFFNFCIRNEWCQRNPVSGLSKLKARKRRIDHFSAAEFLQLILSTFVCGSSVYGSRRRTREAGVRLRALILLLRFSGLRLRDAVTLERSRLNGNRLLVYQDKTGNPVSILLPPIVVQALRSLPLSDSQTYFFWNGSGSRKSAAEMWAYKLRLLFRIADLRVGGTPKRCHSHLFRHTFAIALLTAGVPIEYVSKALGHVSVRTTEEWYADWVPERQQSLEKAITASWATQGIDISTTLTVDRRTQLLGSCSRGIDAAMGAPSNGEAPNLAIDDAETLVSSLQLLSAKLAMAFSGGAQNSHSGAANTTDVDMVVMTLTALGIKLKDEATGLFRRVEIVLLDLCRVFQELQDGGSTKSSLANTLFGGAAVAMIPILNQQRYRVEQLIREAQRGDSAAQAA